MSVFTRRNVLVGGAALVAAGGGASYLLARPAEATIALGAPAPSFSVVDASGRTRTLSEFAGRTLVLEWTNHECPYVRKHYDSGNMQGTQRDAITGGAAWLTVISSAQGEQGNVTAARAAEIARTGNSAPTAILLDASGAMGHAYDARTTPHMFIINAQGRVVYQGAIDDRPRAARSSLEGATNYVRAALGDMAAGRQIATAQTTPYGCSVKYRA